MLTLTKQVQTTQVQRLNEMGPQPEVMRQSGLMITMNHERLTEMISPGSYAKMPSNNLGEESQTLYNRFHKGKAIQVNQRGYRIPFYDRPPASDSFFSEGGAMPVADNPRQNWGRLLEIAALKTSLNRLGC